MLEENTKYLVHVDCCLLACCDVVRTVRKADPDRLINVEAATYISGRAILMRWIYAHVRDFIPG